VPVFGPPNVEKLRSKRDAGGLIKALNWWKKGDERQVALVRKSAAEALGNLGASEAILPLVNALLDSRGDVRAAAAEALSEIGDPRAVVPLVEALSRTSAPWGTDLADIQWAARGALFRICQSVGPDKLGLEKMMRALDDERYDVRSAVAAALGKIRDDRAVDAFVAVLVSRPGPIKREVAKEGLRREKLLRARVYAKLRQVDPETAIVSLLEDFRDEDLDIRREAVDAIGRETPDAVLAVIEKGLRSAKRDKWGDLGERTTALAQLGRIGKLLGWPQTVKLIESSLSDPDEDVAEQALVMLSEAAKNKSLEPIVGEVVTPMLERLVDKFVTMRDLANFDSIANLIRLSGPARIAPLMTALPSLHDERRAMAIEMLTDPAAADALVHLLEPAGSTTSHHAAEALQQIPEFEPDPATQGKIRRAAIYISEGPDHYVPGWYYYVVDRERGLVHAKTEREVDASGGPDQVFGASSYVEAWWWVRTEQDFQQMIDEVAAIVAEARAPTPHTEEAPRPQRRIP
jgi:HEAT repeat protein